MKFILYICIFLSFGFVGLSDRNHLTETKLDFKVVASVRCSDLENLPPGNFIMNNAYDYENTWTLATGSRQNKPIVYLDRDMVFGMYPRNGERIDSITEDDFNINIYTSRNFYTMEVTYTYNFIKMKYSSKDIRLWSLEYSSPEEFRYVIRK